MLVVVSPQPTVSLTVMLCCPASTLVKVYMLSFGVLICQAPPSILNSYTAIDVAVVPVAVTAISCWLAKAKVVTSATTIGGSLTITSVLTGWLAHPVAASVAITL